MNNPVLVSKSGEYEAEEGCLSLLGTRKTTRYKEIEVEYEDINFKKHSLTIDHQLQKRGSTGYYIQTTKTEAGKTEIPMTPDVEECFRKIVRNRKPSNPEPMIDGKSGFLYFDKDGNICYSLHWEHYFTHICQKYNSIYKVQMPKVTPHVCRHTYCSEKAKKGMNPNTLKYLMGCGRPVDDAAKQQHGPSRETRPYGYQRHPEHLHASGTDRCGAGAGTHAERSQNE